MSLLWPYISSVLGISLLHKIIPIFEEKCAVQERNVQRRRENVQRRIEIRQRRRRVLFGHSIYHIQIANSRTTV